MLPGRAHHLPRRCLLRLCAAKHVSALPGVLVFAAGCCLPGLCVPPPVPTPCRRHLPHPPTWPPHATPCTEVGFLLPFNVEALLTPFGALLDMLNNRRLCRCAAGT